MAVFTLLITFSLSILFLCCTLCPCSFCSPSVSIYQLTQPSTRFHKYLSKGKLTHTCSQTLPRLSLSSFFQETSKKIFCGQVILEMWENSYMDGFSYKPLWMIKQRDSVKIVLLLDKWEIIKRLHLLAEFGERERERKHPPPPNRSLHNMTPLHLCLYT